MGRRRSLRSPERTTGPLAEAPHILARCPARPRLACRHRRAQSHTRCSSHLRPPRRTAVKPRPWLVGGCGVPAGASGCAANKPTRPDRGGGCFRPPRIHADPSCWGKGGGGFSWAPPPNSSAGRRRSPPTPRQLQLARLGPRMPPRRDAREEEDRPAPVPLRRRGNHREFGAPLARVHRRRGEIRPPSFPTFSDRLHSLAGRGGAVAAVHGATCPSAHAIKSRKDPTSTIHPATLAKTGGPSHEGDIGRHVGLAAPSTPARSP